MENAGYGVKLKSTETGKWVWHTGKDGEINKFTKDGAENRAAIWGNKSIAKAVKLVDGKKKKKVTRKKKGK